MLPALRLRGAAAVLTRHCCANTGGSDASHTTANCRCRPSNGFGDTTAYSLDKATHSLLLPAHAASLHATG